LAKDLPKIEFKPVTVKGFAAGPWQFVAFLMCVVGFPGAITSIIRYVAHDPLAPFELALSFGGLVVAQRLSVDRRWAKFACLPVLILQAFFVLPVFHR
jgi:hypothetical protein